MKKEGAHPRNKLESIFVVLDAFFVSISSSSTSSSSSSSGAFVYIIVVLKSSFLKHNITHTHIDAPNRFLFPFLFCLRFLAISPSIPLLSFKCQICVWMLVLLVWHSSYHPKYHRQFFLFFSAAHTKKVFIEKAFNNLSMFLRFSIDLTCHSVDVCLCVCVYKIQQWFISHFLPSFFRVNPNMNGGD